MKTFKITLLSAIIFFILTVNRDYVQSTVQTSEQSCSINSLPSVIFAKGAFFDNAAKATLDTAARLLNANPDCKVKLIGYGASSEIDQLISWEKVNTVKFYLVQKAGISESRIIFTYGQDGDTRKVDLAPTLEDGPNIVPAPMSFILSNKWYPHGG